ncbi:MAG TPA: hypothetical protein VHF45_11365 [Thermoleophilaceae bacterium]|nr:hypothetical protein [Thermoleophilaceae bacterium]
MATNRDVPPTHTIKPMDAPPESDRPTTAQLKADIDSGATGDKNEVFDPALSPLGTDDEAAGTPPSRQRIELARYQERFQRWLRRARKGSAAHGKPDEAATAFATFIAIVAVIFVGAIWAL